METTADTFVPVPIPKLSTLRTAELLLRNPRMLLSRIHEGGEAARELPMQLVLLAGLGFACYGLILGLAHSPLMGLLAGPKLVFVGLGSLAICLPALHVFGKLLGNRARLSQGVGESLTAVATTGMTLLALCPVLLAFLKLVESTQGRYQYTVLGAAALLGFACLRGIWILYLALRDERRPTVHLAAWTLIFGLVGVQCAWVARPFVGAPTPDDHVQFLRPLEGTAFDALYRAAPRAVGIMLSECTQPSSETLVADGREAALPESRS